MWRADGPTLPRTRPQARGGVQTPSWWTNLIAFLLTGVFTTLTYRSGEGTSKTHFRLENEERQNATSFNNHATCRYNDPGHLRCAFGVAAGVWFDVHATATTSNSTLSANTVTGRGRYPGSLSAIIIGVGNNLFRNYRDFNADNHHRSGRKKDSHSL